VRDQLLQILARLLVIEFETPKNITLIIPFMLLLFMLLGARLGRRRIGYYFTRLIIVSLIFIALASPYTPRGKKEVAEVSSIRVLVDGSASMRIFGDMDAEAHAAYSRLKEVVRDYTSEEDVVLSYFSRGNATAVGDVLYRETVSSAKQNSILVLVSDGISNTGRDPRAVSKLLRNSNVTAYTILPSQTVNDIAVAGVFGASKTPLNSDYDLTVVVNKSGFNSSEYRLRLTVDGVERDNRFFTQAKNVKYVSFTLNFEDVGVHTIGVNVTQYSPDFFSENNYFVKTVEVINRPKVLLVTREPDSPLRQVLDRLYEVTVSGYVGGDELGEYAAVYVDDVEAAVLDAYISQFRQYIVDGNGMVFVGGNHSFDLGGYNSSFVEGLLPVRSLDKPPEMRKPISVLFLIDISQSGEYKGVEETTLNIEKANAIRLIKELELNDSVGVVAFNVKAFTVSDFVQVAGGRADVIDRIMRLQPGGDTDMVGALSLASEKLSDVSGDRYLIVLSDGIIRLSRVHVTLNYFKTLSDRGVKNVLVGVGSDRVGLATMKAMAMASDSLFYQPDEFERLSLLFAREPSEDEEGDISLSTYSHHFITRNLKLGYTNVKGVNNVREKKNAQVLVSTDAGLPVLTVWRFGLGRVAALSTDDGRLWATKVYSADDSKLVSALTNWVIGDLEKTKAVNIEVGDIFLGDTVRIRVKSSVKPELKVNGPGGAEETLALTKMGVDIFGTSFTPQETGAYSVFAKGGAGFDRAGFAVNYPVEYRDIGQDLTVLSSIAVNSDGRVFEASDVEELAAEVHARIKENSVIEVVDKKHLAAYFLLAALTLYFIDTCARRMGEIVRLRRVS